jgi:hypothetical protein
MTENFVPDFVTADMLERAWKNDKKLITPHVGQFFLAHLALPLLKKIIINSASCPAQTGSFAKFFAVDGHSTRYSY